MSQDLQSQIKLGIEQVYAKAGSDPAFRALCLSDSKAAIKQVTGYQAPAWAKVRFIENQGADVTFILPDLPTAGGELADEDLEHVAGGTDKFNFNLPPSSGGGGGGGGGGGANPPKAPIVVNWPSTGGGGGGGGGGGTPSTPKTKQPWER